MTALTCDRAQYKEALLAHFAHLENPCTLHTGFNSLGTLQLNPRSTPSLKDQSMSQWKCFEETNAAFKLFATSLANFDAAVELCKAESATLARISSLAENDFVKELVEEFENPVDVFWLGIHDPIRTVGASGTARLRYVNGFNEMSFFQNAFQKPWNVAEPFNLDGRQSCVSWVVSFLQAEESISFDNEWDDTSCQRELSFLCRRPCESSAPISATQALLVASLVIIPVLFFISLIMLSKKKKQLKMSRWS